MKCERCYGVIFALSKQDFLQIIAKMNIFFRVKKPAFKTNRIKNLNKNIIKNDN